MEALVIVVGLVVVPALVAALVVALVASRRRVPAPDPSVQRAERDDAINAAIEQMVRMNEQAIAAERRLGSQELEGKKSLIDQELVGMRGELEKLTSLVHDIERERREHVGQLTSQLAEAGRTTQVLTETTQSLREALSSTTARGQWGERMADDVLRLAGFVDGVNYRRRQAMAGSGGIPDYTFMLPQGLSLHMDVKFPLNNYLRYLDATSDVERERWRKEFLKDVRLRLKEVTSRDYVDVAANTVDCVLLFIPNESVYAFVQEHDRALLDDALRNKIVLCSPLTLYAVLAVVRQAVDNFRLERKSNEILQLLGEFSTQWTKYVAQLDKVHRRLDAVAADYAALMSTRDRALQRPLDKIDGLRRDHSAEVALVDQLA